MVFWLAFLGLYLLQSFVNAVGAGFDLHFPFTTFLADPTGLFDDYFKAIATFQQEPQPLATNFLSLGQAGAGPLWSTSQILQQAASRVTNFHLPPLTQLIYLISLWSQHWISGPQALIATSAICAAPLLLTAPSSPARPSKPWLIALAATLLSYPFLLGLSRGNISSIACGSTLIWASSLWAQGRSNQARLAGMLFVSIRPNLLPVYLLLCCQPASGKPTRNVRRFLLGIALVIVANALFLILAHSLNPAFSLQSFLVGYKAYVQEYEVGSTGLAFGSSVTGAEKLLLYGPGLHGNLLRALAAPLKDINLLAGLGLAFIIAWGYGKQRFTKAEAFFLAMDSCLLLTPTFADYHLIGFCALLFPSFTTSLNGDSASEKTTDQAKYGFFAWLPKPKLNQIQQIALAIMVAPLAYYIFPGKLISVGVFLRPLATMTCFLGIALPSLTRIRRNASTPIA